jgi:hypothetical protein
MAVYITYSMTDALASAPEGVVPVRPSSFAVTASNRHLVQANASQGIWLHIEQTTVVVPAVPVRPSSVAVTASTRALTQRKAAVSDWSDFSQLIEARVHVESTYTHWSKRVVPIAPQ